MEAFDFNQCLVKLPLHKSTHLKLKEHNHISVSQHVRNAIEAVIKDRRVLWPAIERRLKGEVELNPVRTTMWSNTDHLAFMTELAQKSGFSRDELIRLATEAYARTL
jgi:hypothetical protein